MTYLCWCNRPELPQHISIIRLTLSSFPQFFPFLFFVVNLSYLSRGSCTTLSKEKKLYLEETITISIRQQGKSKLPLRPIAAM